MPGELISRIILVKLFERLRGEPLGNCRAAAFSSLLKRVFTIPQLCLLQNQQAGQHQVIPALTDKNPSSAPALNPQPCGTLISFEAHCSQAPHPPTHHHPSREQRGRDLRPKTFPRSHLGSVSFSGEVKWKQPHSQMDFTASQFTALSKRLLTVPPLPQHTHS